MANEKRLIDVDKAKKDFNLHFGGVSHAVIANRILDEQPTVDAVEVVRCKDCKHWEDGYFGYCTKIHSTMEYDAFCSNGERREGE